MSVSVIGLGTWQLGGEWGTTFTARDARAIFDAAREQGITLVDTAECYGDHLAERLVGEAIREDRDRWVVATKFGHRYTVPFEREQAWTAAAVQEQLEDSLAGPRHRLDRPVPVPLGHARRLRQRGAVERCSPGRSRRASSVTSGSPLPAPSPRQTSSTRFGGPGRWAPSACRWCTTGCSGAPRTRFSRTASSDGLGVLARVPLASGFLSGKYTAGASFAPGDIRSRRSAEEIARLAAEAERIRREEVPEGSPMAAWALAWCLRPTAVTAVIPGCRDPLQVRQNASAADLVA